MRGRKGGKKRNVPSIVNHLCNQARPPALMCRAEPSAGIAVEKLVKPQVIPPVGVEIQGIVAAVDAPAAVVVALEQVLQAVLDLLGHVAQVHVLARADGAFDLEVVAEIEEEALQRLDE